MKKQVIVCIDDEPTVLSSLRRELKSSIGNDFTIETAVGGVEALELLEDLVEEGREIALVISDYQMPGVMGDEVLKRFHEVSPGTLKILLTGQASIEGITNAINSAKLYRYIAKPWQTDDFSLTVKEALKSYFQAQKLAEQNARLRQNERRLTQFLEAIPIGISVHDAGGHLTYANQKARELLGIEALPVTIEQLANVYRLYESETGELYPADKLPIARSLSGEIVHTDDIELRQGDRNIPLEISSTPIQDDSGKLYFATCITSKSPKAEHIRVSTIPASFVHNLMNNISCQRQVVILDGCFRNLSTEIAVNHDGTADIKTQLGGEGRTILTSFTFIHNSFNSQGFNPSPYTRYLVEGIRTGAADLDSDGWISVDELHQYASNKVQTVAPAVKPEFYPSENSSKILLAKVLLDNPELKYRKEAESWIRRGEISEGGRYILSKLAESLRLSSQNCTVIEAEVLKPYQEYQEKLQCYKHNFAKAVSKDYPLGTQEREDLKSLQQSLGLREEDIAPIEERITLKLANLSSVEDNVDEFTQSDSESKLNSLSSTFSKLIPESKLIPPLVLTNPTPESEDDINEPVQLDSQSQQNSVPSTPSIVTPESTPIPALAATNPTPAINLSSSLPDSQTSSVSASTFPNKSFSVTGTPS